MKNEIIPDIPDSNPAKEAWKQARETWRLPYWDWAIPQVDYGAGKKSLVSRSLWMTAKSGSSSLERRRRN
jgi:hypothetical protein